MKTASLQQAILFLGILGPASLSAAADWPQFRGPGGRGISEETDVPTTWSRDANIRWRAELPPPGNNGSPIVSGDSVFLAVATDAGRRRSLHCYDRDSGGLRWVRTVDFDGEEPTHGTSLYAGSTPVADGRRVVVWHSSAGMHCYDFGGNPLWSRDLGRFSHIWGYGASPVIHGDLVVNNCGPGERTFLVALNKHDGRVVWKSDEPGGSDGREKPWIGSWSTPILAGVDGADQILLSFPHHVKAYRPGDGVVLWQVDGLDKLVYTSVLVDGGLAVAMGGYRGPAIAWKLGGSGNVTRENRLWRIEKNPQAHRLRPHAGHADADGQRAGHGRVDRRNDRPTALAEAAARPKPCLVLSHRCRRTILRLQSERRHDRLQSRYRRARSDRGQLPGGKNQLHDRRRRWEDLPPHAPGALLHRVAPRTDRSRLRPPGAIAVGDPRGQPGGDLGVFLELEVEHPHDDEVGPVAEGVGEALLGWMAPAASTL